MGIVLDRVRNLSIGYYIDSQSILQLDYSILDHFILIILKLKNFYRTNECVFHVFLDFIKFSSRNLFENIFH